MEHIKAFFGNYLLISAVFGWMIAQFMKIFTGAFSGQGFHIKHMFANGGMPSSHSSTVLALTTASAVQYGAGSAVFAISAILSIIVMNDATGVRRETGKQSKALNLILQDMFTDSPEKFDENFRELIGHTPLQVVCGAITGFVVAMLMSLIPVFGAWT